LRAISKLKDKMKKRLMRSKQAETKIVKWRKDLANKAKRNDKESNTRLLPPNEEDEFMCSYEGKIWISIK